MDLAEIQKTNESLLWGQFIDSDLVVQNAREGHFGVWPAAALLSNVISNVNFNAEHILTVTFKPKEGGFLAVNEQQVPIHITRDNNIAMVSLGEREKSALITLSVSDNFSTAKAHIYTSGDVYDKGSVAFLHKGSWKLSEGVEVRISKNEGFDVGSEVTGSCTFTFFDVDGKIKSPLRYLDGSIPAPVVFERAAQGIGAKVLHAVGKSDVSPAFGALSLMLHKKSVPEDARIQGEFSLKVVDASKNIIELSISIFANGEYIGSMNGQARIFKIPMLKRMLGIRI